MAATKADHSSEYACALDRLRGEVLPDGAALAISKRVLAARHDTARNNLILKAWVSLYIQCGACSFGHLQVFLCNLLLAEAVLD